MFRARFAILLPFISCSVVENDGGCRWGMGNAPTPSDSSTLSDSGTDLTTPDSLMLDSSVVDSQSVSIWSPTPGTSWQWQLTGALDTSHDVVMYDIDLVDTSKLDIQKLKSNGRIVICYFSAGSWEDWRPDASSFPKNTLGNTLSGWPDEKWLDIRDTTVRNLMKQRLNLAVSKGCDGVEPDNVDGYTNKTGFPLTYQDQLDYNKFLSTEAHKRYLSIGLKNNTDQVKDLVNYFDWALNEECIKYNECNTLLPFIQNNKPVFHVEYKGDTVQICSEANKLNFDTLIKDINLGSSRISCR